VHVILGVGRQIEVQHAGHAVDVDPTRGNVGGHQRRHLAVGERFQCPGALPLGTPTMDRRRFDAHALELLRHPVGAVARAAEHHRRACVIDEISGKRQLLRAIGFDEAMAHGGKVGFGFPNLVAHRLMLIAVDQYLHVVVECRRVQLSLAALGRHVQQLADRGQKAHVGHAVGLIDHHLVDVTEADTALLDQVGQPSWTCDEDVDAPVQRRALWIHADAAVDGQHVAAPGRRQRLKLATDLFGQLTGGRQHQGARLARGAAPHLGDQWQAEGQRLTRAGWGTSQHVTAGESVGDGSDLDVKRGDDAGAFKHGGQVVGHAKRAERRNGGIH
jgi:hypothetical protein